MNDPELASAPFQVLKGISKSRVTLAIGLIVVTVALLYTFNFIQDIPCESNPIHIFSRNFIHSHWPHLLINVFVLVTFIPLEMELGAKKYLSLIVLLLVLQTIVEWVASKMFKFKCSIGLSGLLFGLFTWSIFTQHKIEWSLLLSVIVSLMVPSLTNSNISFSGHLIGVISGLLAIPITKWMKF